MTAPAVALVHGDGLCGYGCSHLPVEAVQRIACRAWLRVFGRPRPTMNRRCGTYFMRTLVEHAVGHRISNGALIGALIDEGYEIVRVDRHSLSVFANVSVRRSA